MRFDLAPREFDEQATEPRTVPELLVAWVEFNFGHNLNFFARHPCWWWS